jgi:hypothetical protein
MLLDMNVQGIRVGRVERYLTQYVEKVRSHDILRVRVRVCIKSVPVLDK